MSSTTQTTTTLEVWCKPEDPQMQDIIEEESAVRFCRVTTEEGGGEGGGGGVLNNNNINKQQDGETLGRSIANGIMNGMILEKDEKRMRREIANSNERRRMQSINAGFQSLRQMLPHHEGEKLSKVSDVLPV
ncbi:uncharacterized protein LOC129750180 isoform X2 [Uranotaenia lowii]|uniref:uncharacterized protein LOC129750180 isoform X2 n=1 Tax=Uranotaenia lowii TaxID=190385 RepID=UPI0024793EDF|nr:uncharacterized protein LOC129750180 isoform X2 [Uranotaenia lowii]